MALNEEACGVVILLASLLFKALDLVSIGDTVGGRQTGPKGSIFLLAPPLQDQAGESG